MMKAWGYGLEALLLYALGAAAVDGPGSAPVRRDGNVTAAPIIASVSQYFEGNDGAWSSFDIQVGNKAQSLRVFPSTSATATWVVEAQGCLNAPNACPDSRGHIFYPNTSLTWVPISIFNLGLEENLGYSGVNGDFGYDTVTLGLPGSGGPSIEHSIVAGIADQRISWLGVLGLSPLPTNFSTFNNPQPSFVSLLKTKNMIPSLSWSYTAGAVYRFNKIFASLIFGGYDSSKFIRSDVTFPFYEDVERRLLVGIQKITTDASSTPLLSDGIFALIDSTVPHLWLPQTVCEAFEKAFGLTWNSTAELYLLNDTTHTNLAKKNPNVTITIGPTASGGSTVDIVFPYAAFDLTVSYPFVENSTRYFPLKRAVNSTQYTLGRTFLQEAYLIADFERSNFSVFPVKWDQNAKPSVVAIRPIGDTGGSNGPSGDGGGNTPGKDDNKQHGTSIGIIVGPVVGGVIVLLVLGAIWWLKRTRRLSLVFSKKPSFELEGGPSPPIPHIDTAAPKIIGTEGGELASREIHELQDPQNGFGMVEAEAILPMEMEAKEADPVYEMEGSHPTPGVIYPEKVGLSADAGELLEPLVPPPPPRTSTPGSVHSHTTQDDRITSSPRFVASPSPRSVSPQSSGVSPPTAVGAQRGMPPLNRTWTDVSMVSLAGTVTPQQQPTPRPQRDEADGTCVPLNTDGEERGRRENRVIGGRMHVEDGGLDR